MATSLLFFILGISIPSVESASVENPTRPGAEVYVPNRSSALSTDERVYKTTTAPAGAIQFRHGDVSWLPNLAITAGWEPKHLPMLTEIILRESGGCPNRRGGDIVDKDCNITGVSEWNHRSDTGLLQINGVNYDVSRNKWAAVCRELNICTQEPLLDALTNLRAGRLLYELSGWSPWDPCTWGGKGCKSQKKAQNP